MFGVGSIIYRGGVFSPTETRGNPKAGQLAQKRALARGFEKIHMLREQLTALKEALGADKPRGLPAAVSSNGLSLDTTPRELMSVSSHSEINTAPTSFTPRHPVFSGDSTARPTIGGEYNGSTDQTITFSVVRNRTVGGRRRLVIDALDENGARLERIRMQGAAGTEHTMKNGLTLAFGEGRLERGDTFTVDVSASVGSRIDPTKAFDDPDANLDAGFSIRDGAFKLNGTAIRVHASDSLVDVLARINEADIGVSAKFDGASEKVVLSRTVAGEVDIVLADDTSGFVAAMKLDGVSTQRYTTLQGGAIGDLPTGFGPTSPRFSGRSTSKPTVSGQYNGDIDDTLTFRVMRDRQVGGRRPIRLEVRNGNNEIIDEVRFARNAPPGTKVALRNGLEISLSEGDVRRGDTFQVDVFADRLPVKDGSFEVNGTKINVFAGDGIDDVLARINKSDAGVSATYDKQSDSVLLQRTRQGALDITLDNDTSGFLKATRLDGAAAQLGAVADVSDLDTAIVDIEELSAMNTGTFEINGTMIHVDVDSDTLRDVVERINNSSAGVLATVRQGRFELMSGDKLTPIELTAGTASFFEAMRIEEGIYAPTIELGVDGAAAAESMEEATAALSGLVQGSFSVDATVLSSLRSDLLEVFQSATDAKSSIIRTGFGLELDFRENGKTSDVAKRRNAARFAAAVRQKPDEIKAFFLEGGDESVLESLLTRLDAAEAEIKEAVGTRAVMMSLLA